MTFSRRTVLQVSTAALIGLGAAGAWAQTATEAAAPRQTQSDDYTRYELLDPSSASFRIVYEVTATKVEARRVAQLHFKRAPETLAAEDRPSIERVGT